MDKKKLTTSNKSSSAASSKQIPPAAKGKTSMNQTPRTAPSSETNNPTARMRRASLYVSGIQNYILFWLDSNITEEDDNSRNTIAQLQSIINTVHVFNDAEECATFLNKVKREKVFMVVSGRLGQQIVPQIHSMPQLVAVFVFCSNKSDYESWASNWIKVRGVFTNINDVYESLKQVARQYDQDSLDISLVSASDISGQNLGKLDQSFMYTQLIKEILLELEYNDEDFRDLITFCRKKYLGKPSELKQVQKFQDEYPDKSPIWWYTLEIFLYHMLNRALRSQEIEVILKLGFFIRDLHRHIEQLHKKQSKGFQKKFTLYRGQALLSDIFDKIKDTKGGLLSFNTFLSTSTEPEIATAFAESALVDPSLVGVLFIISIDTSVPSAPFANLDEVSCYKTKEKEILFSMHTVFRISDIKRSNRSNGLWDVHLTLTSDNDQQLNTLMERMRVEIKGSSALYRLGTLMIKLGEFEKAEEVFENLLKRTFDEVEKGHIYYQLGQVKDNQEMHEEALESYQDALKIYLKKLSQDHSNIATCYNNIGLVYDNKNDYPQALKFYEKALEIYRKTLPDNHPNVATCSNSIGMAHNSMGDYQKALESCKSAHETFVNSPTPNHPLVATSYNNLGLIYANMKRYSEAVISYKRAVEIGEQVLPPNHPTLLIYKQNLESVRKKEKK
jgi:tetratricopeptide (TPR) repeat protein